MCPQVRPRVSVWGSEKFLTPYRAATASMAWSVCVSVSTSVPSRSNSSARTIPGLVMQQSLFYATGSGERLSLAPGRIEIPWIEPVRVRAAQSRPVAIQHRVPGGVTVLSLDHQVLAEDTLELEAEAQRRPPRWLIQRIAFPFEASITKLVKHVACH